MRSRRWIGVVLAATLTPVAAGCAHVSSQASGGAAHQRVTTGFGATGLVDAAAREGTTALDALRAAAPVETAYGGGFVSAVRDVKSDRDGRRDWFFYVNGIIAPVGANEITLRPGDRIWWDYRPWGGLADAWTVVGDWPEPFVHGDRTPPQSVAAEAPLAASLSAAGARVATAASPWRVRVGETGALARRDPAWRRAMANPDRAGLTVRFTAIGVEALGRDGRTWVDVPGARAVAAAVPTGDLPERGVLLAVAGLDDAAARAAAGRIASDPGVLRGRYAVVFDARGAPIAAGGQAGA